MADRYWVGGSASWDGTAGTKWALTSGGAGGEAVPTAADDVYIDAGSGAVTVTVSAAAVCNNLSFTSGAGAFAGTFTGGSGITVSGSLTLVAGMTITHSGSFTFNATTTGKTIASAGKSIDGTFTFNGAGGEWQLQDDLTLGSGRSISLTNGTLDINGKTVEAHRLVSNNANTRTIKFGSGTLNLRANNANVIDMANATGFTYTGTSNVVSTYSGATGTRAFTFGTIAGGTETNALNLTINAGTDAILVTNIFNNLNFGSYAGTLGAQARSIFGDITLSAFMTISGGTDITTLVGTSGTSTFTSNGVTIDIPINVNAPGKTWRFADAFALGSSRLLRLTNGTLDAQANNVSVGSFALGSGTKTLSLGSGTWTVDTNWDANTNVANLTVNASTATINMASTSAKSFAGGGKAWPVLNQGGAGALTIQQSNTFANITNTVQPVTITLTAGTTQTVTDFDVSGTSGNLITLNSSTPGARATLTDSGGVNTVSYVSITDIAAAGYGEWIAYTSDGNVDGGNNVGWVFTAPSPLIASEYQISLKSFTERRSF